VTRLADDAFLVVTGAASQTRDFHWLKQHIGDEHAVVTDVTSAYAVLAIMGPDSRRILAGLTPAALDDAAFPFATAREIELGHALVRAHRISYVGELGYELYIPSEFAPAVYDVLTEGAGAALRPVGMHALDSLRLEKAFRHFGHDICDEDTPIEAGLGFACALDKAVPFIGHEVIADQKGKVPQRRLVQFRLQDPEPLLFHDEPIVMDGERIGLLTSGSYGHWLGRAIGMGYVHHPEGVTADLLQSARFEIEIAGERHAAEPSLRAFHDPKGLRMRG
jgi:4-methylaminobutanoate oxidase (formaldehyde-forming)